MTPEVISSNDIDTLQNRLTSSADKRKLDKYEDTAQEAKSIGMDFSVANQIVEKLISLPDAEFSVQKNTLLSNLDNSLQQIQQDILAHRVDDVKRNLNIAPQNTPAQTQVQPQQSTVTQVSPSVQAQPSQPKPRIRALFTPNGGSNNSSTPSKPQVVSQPKPSATKLSVQPSVFSYDRAYTSLKALRDTFHRLGSHKTAQDQAFLGYMQSLLQELSHTDFYDRIARNDYQNKIDESLQHIVTIYDILKTGSNSHRLVEINPKLQELQDQRVNILATARTDLDKIQDDTAEILENGVTLFDQSSSISKTAPHMYRNMEAIKALSGKPIEDIFDEAKNIGMIPDPQKPGSYIPDPELGNISSGAFNQLLYSLENKGDQKSLALRAFLVQNQREFIEAFENLPESIAALKDEIDSLRQYAEAFGDMQSPELRDELVGYTSLLYLLDMLKQAPNESSIFGGIHNILRWLDLPFFASGGQGVEKLLKKIFPDFEWFDYTSLALGGGIMMVMFINKRRLARKAKPEFAKEARLVTTDNGERKMQVASEEMKSRLSIEQQENVKQLEIFKEFALKFGDSALVARLDKLYHGPIMRGKGAFARELLLTLFNTNGAIRPALLRYFDLHLGRKWVEMRNSPIGRARFGRLTPWANRGSAQGNPVLDPNIQNNYKNASDQVSQIVDQMRELLKGEAKIAQIDFHPNVFGDRELTVQTARRNLITDIINPNNIIARNIIAAIQQPPVSHTFDSDPKKAAKQKAKLQSEITLVLDKKFDKTHAIAEAVLDAPSWKSILRKLRIGKGDLRSQIKQGIEAGKTEQKDMFEQMKGKKLSQFMNERLTAMAPDGVVFDKEIETYIERNKIDITQSDVRSEIQEAGQRAQAMIDHSDMIDSRDERTRVLGDLIKEITDGKWTGTTGEFYMRLGNILTSSPERIYQYKETLNSLNGLHGTNLVNHLKDAKTHFRDLTKNFTKEARGESKKITSQKAHLDSEIKRVDSVSSIEELTALRKTFDDYKTHVDISHPDLKQKVEDFNIAYSAKAHQLNTLSTTEKISALGDDPVKSNESVENPKDSPQKTADVKESAPDTLETKSQQVQQLFRRLELEMRIAGTYNKSIAAQISSLKRKYNDINHLTSLKSIDHLEGQLVSRFNTDIRTLTELISSVKFIQNSPNQKILLDTPESIYDPGTWRSLVSDFKTGKIFTKALK